MASELWTLLKDAQKEYLERRKNYPDEDPSDVAYEVADSNVPIYTADLMRLAAEDIDLATREPDIGPAFDGKPTPSESPRASPRLTPVSTAVNIIAANVYEMILEAINEVQAEES